MPEFMPFRQFQDEIHGSKVFLAPMAAANVPAASSAMGQVGGDVLEYVRARYANVEVSNSFVDAAGQHVDCIRLNQQPSLRGAEKVDSPPAFEEMRGTAAEKPSAFAAIAALAEDKKDAFGNQVYCPPGFVPVVRVTPARIASNGGLTSFFQKAPGGGKHPSLGSGTDQTVPVGGAAPGGGVVAPMQVVNGVIHAYAHAAQWVQGTGCIGARSWLNLWAPDPSPGVFSLSQQWIAGGQGAGLQTIEGGWHVYPALHQESQPTARLFIFWTADGYQTTGAYNLSTRPGQGGFVQVDNTWVIGGAFRTSVAGGDQQGFLMQWQRDPANGNWWLFLQGTGQPVAVGYYPASLYGAGPLSDSAWSVDFGGEVCGQPNSKTTGPMGSGQQASAGWQGAAFHKEIAYLTSGGWVPATLSPDERDAPAYTIDLHNNSSSAWSTYFYYGGPGAVFP